MKLCVRMTSHVRTTELYIIEAIYFYRSFKSSFIIFIFSSNFHINTVMYCPGCGSEHNSVEEMYCGNCSSERDANQLLKVYFGRGYPYDAIVGLLAAQGFHVSALQGSNEKAFSLTKTTQTSSSFHFFLSGYRSIWHALRLRHGIHVMHLSMLSRRGGRAGNGRGFEFPLRFFVKCPVLQEM